MGSARTGESRLRMRRFGWFAVFAIVLAIFGTLSLDVGIAADRGKVITLGESLTPDQRQELLNLFQAGPDDTVYTITEAETNEAMAGVLDEVGAGVTGAFSSTALTCRPLGDGLDVTTRNITLVTPSMYAMALVTAGIGDATLVVAAPSTAPALGLTAMAGVFKTWDLAPCDSGNTTPERQRLALEELALTAEIGQALILSGRLDGVQLASNVILETQKIIVTEKLKKSSEIEEAVRAQEAAAGIVIPDNLRAELIDLFVRLVKADIDWSTFSAGWTITYADNDTRITMTGEGIAIRRARQTATAQAKAAKTATAEARAALTATAEASKRMTATAEAAMTATAQAEAAMTATAQAAAAMTATAAAQPTATPTPSPTPTPAPFAVTGTISKIQDLTISIKPEGGKESVDYVVEPDAKITREGEASTIASLKKGDEVTLTVDGNTQHVREIVATAAPVSPLANVMKLWWVIPVIGLVGAVIALRGKVGDRDPFVVKRIAAA